MLCWLFFLRGGGKLNHLSPSLINKFLACPRAFKFELENQRQIKTDDSAMMFGKAIHNIIVTFYNKLSRKSPDEAIEEAIKENEMFIPKNYKRKLNRVKGNFLDFYYKNKEPIFLEKKFKATLFDDLPAFVGIIDAYYPNGLVIDWKTGNEDLIGNGTHSIQGKIYEMLMEAKGYEVKKVIFVYLDNGKIMQLPRTTKGLVYQKAKSVMNMIEKGYFPAKRGYWCKYCPYRLACEFEATPYWVMI